MQSRNKPLRYYVTNKQVYDSLIEITGLDKKTITGFWNEAFNEIANYLMDGNLIHLPYMIGELKLHKQPDTREEMIDYGATNKARRAVHPDWTNEDWAKLPYEQRLLVRITNSHSDGWVYRVIWDRQINQHKSCVSKFFDFQPNRNNFSRKLAKRIKDGDAPLVEQIKIKNK
jgi:hypothetical protein